jgi:hypothetical protein
VLLKSLYLFLFFFYKISSLFIIIYVIPFYNLREFSKTCDES